MPDYIRRHIREILDLEDEKAKPRRLLAEPHYLTPLEPPNAIGDAKANRQYELTLGLAEDCFLVARLLLNDRSSQTRTLIRSGSNWRSKSSPMR